MYHSLIISGKNTYAEWGLIPTSRPVVNPPEVKTTYVDLPASHGVLDYTSLLLGEVPYGQRKGSWEFSALHRSNSLSVYSSLLNYLHGERHTVVLEDEPRFQYTGRLAVNEWKSDPVFPRVTIDYDLDPFRQSVHASDENDWLWDDLFEGVIRYGTFTVSGTMYRTFINEGSRAVVPTFTCSSSLTVEYGENTYTLMAGKNYNANLSLPPGDSVKVFHGNGSVTVSYREVSL